MLPPRNQTRNSKLLETHILNGSSFYGYQNLAYNFANRKLEPFMVTVAPNDSNEIPVSVHSGHEYHYCVEGRFIMKIDNHEYVIEEGDSIYFVSTSPHGMKALDGKPAKILVIIV